ncbi:MAG: family transcriptional regulator [Neobacillus sp.]|nr:family transcriptional regulator [Neobacillus sp.]
MNTEELKNIVGNRISERKQELGLRDEDIAKQVGVNRSTVTNWIRGKRAPGNTKISLLADALKTSTDYLNGKTDNPLPNTNDVRNIEELLINGDYIHNGQVVDQETKQMFLRILDSIMVNNESQKQ